jgi:hypothetical protein
MISSKNAEWAETSEKSFGFLFASGIGFNRLRRVIPSKKWILFAHQAVFREIAEVRGVSAGKISVTRKIKRGARKISCRSPKRPPRG